MKLSAQDLNNLRITHLEFKSDTIKFDSLSVIPGSEKISDSLGNLIDDKFFRINYVTATIIINGISKNKYHSLYITYRVFPYNFSKTTSHKDVNRIEPDESGMYNPFLFKYIKKTEDIFFSEGLYKSGSISRGISFGNNQDAVVNSNFNLQLSGKLSKDIDILAAITDNNIPIQPDGNTQQIQEFDKVFIQLSNKKSKLIVGDFEITRPDSYFLNLFKKAQGGSFSTAFNLSKKKNTSLMKVVATAAVSKGKYARNFINGVEGNQGPYKLRGIENETFIIILAGTEKVYIDGRLLSRGQENDYTIDYNIAEVTFTPNNLITKDKRIVVEFEYSDKHYARSMFFINDEFETKKLKVKFNYFSEQDIKNQSIQPELSPEQKYQLSIIGDSLNKAFYPNIDSVGYGSNEILYKMVDTLVYGFIFDSVFVHSTNPDSAYYRLGFSNVGQGNGNYIQVKSSANGRVFQWIAPDQIGNLQGSFEPVVLLITPKKKQMVTIGTEYAFSENTKTSIEFGYSNNDINTFSSKNNDDNSGFAIKANFINTSRFGKNDIKKYKLISEANYEFVNKYFSPIEPYRDIEFNRDWNITNTSTAENEHIAGLSLLFEETKNRYINYMLRLFNKGEKYNAYQNILNVIWDKKNFLFTFNSSYMNSKETTFNTGFLKHKVGLSKKINWLIIGIKEEQEHNTFKAIRSDSLMANSFSYNEWGIFVKNSDSTTNKFSLTYNIRYDHLPRNNVLMLATKAENFGLLFELLKYKNNRLSLSTTYRRLHIKDSISTKQEPDNTIVGRLEYFTKKFKGAVTSNTYYEVGSGLEVKKEFTYLKVADGEGVYTWTDYNNDGIEQLDEFEVSIFKDKANYLRIYTPTNSYEKVFSNQFSEVLNINPVIVWRSKKGFKKLLSHFSNQSVYRIDHKTGDDDILKAYNPFTNELSDTALKTMNSSFRNTIYFNRNHKKFDVDFSFQSNKNKSLLVNGFESRKLIKKGINLRININRFFSVKAGYIDGVKTNSSEYFSSKDYDIKYFQIKPTVIFQPNTSFRLNLFFEYTEKTNRIGSQREHSANQNAGVEINYRIVTKGSLLLKVNYINIKFNSNENSSLAYEMLQGLRSGKNATWNLSYQRNLANNLQLNLVYDGRKSPDVKTIHVGSVQLRAYF